MSVQHMVPLGLHFRAMDIEAKNGSVLSMLEEMLEKTWSEDIFPSGSRFWPYLLEQYFERERRRNIVDRVASETPARLIDIAVFTRRAAVEVLSIQRLALKAAQFSELRRPPQTVRDTIVKPTLRLRHNNSFLADITTSTQVQTVGVDASYSSHGADKSLLKVNSRMKLRSSHMEEWANHHKSLFWIANKTDFGWKSTLSIISHREHQIAAAHKSSTFGLRSLIFPVKAREMRRSALERYEYQEDWSKRLLDCTLQNLCPADINPNDAKTLQYRSLITAYKSVITSSKCLFETLNQAKLYLQIFLETGSKRALPLSGSVRSFTICRTFLCDAIKLIRGDRWYAIDCTSKAQWYTTDCTPEAVCSWGHNQADPDSTVDHVHYFDWLFYAIFPDHFKRDSVYAHFLPIVLIKIQEVLRRIRSDMKYFSSIVTRRHCIWIKLINVDISDQALVFGLALSLYTGRYPQLRNTRTSYNLKPSTHEQFRTVPELLLWSLVFFGSTTYIFQRRDKAGDHWQRLFLSAGAVAGIGCSCLFDATVARACLQILPPWLAAALLISWVCHVMLFVPAVSKDEGTPAITTKGQMAGSG